MRHRLTAALKGAPPARALTLCLPLGLLGVATVYFALWVAGAYEQLRASSRAMQRAFLVAGVDGVVHTLIVFAVAAAAFMLLACVLGVAARNRWTLSIARKAYLASGALVLLYAYVVFHLSGIIEHRELEINGQFPDAVTVFYWRWDFLWPAALVTLAAAALYVFAWRRATINLYTGASDPAPAPGDLVVENIRTHGEDPQYRKSWLSSVGLHVTVLIIIPFLLGLIGCVQRYRIPKGSGDPVVALVQIVQPRKEKKKTYILRPNSAIYFHVPDLDDSEIIKQVEQMTQLTYKADPNARAGRMGRGGGKTGGWPEGMDKAVVRFIRLEYNGRGWDDGMDPVTRADINFLQEFHRLTGFKVASKGESHPIRLLRRYEKGYAPPFVYMTGDQSISVSEAEIKILREYLLDGGMLFADCGSISWDRSFRAFAARLFPGEALRVIADDDPIFQVPYTFPNGAPPLWHHGGTRALGIKHKGRWVVFYHPGDINDAWKERHSGMDPELARGGFQMGVNIVYYAFTHYLEETAKYRK
jgi:hypothetical protein